MTYPRAQLKWHDARETDKIESYQTGILELPGPIYITGFYAKHSGQWMTTDMNGRQVSLADKIIKRFSYFPFSNTGDL